MPWPSRKIPSRDRLPWAPPAKPTRPPATVRIMRGGREIEVDAEIVGALVRYEVALKELLTALHADPTAPHLSLVTRNKIDAAFEARFPDA